MIDKTKRKNEQIRSAQMRVIFNKDNLGILSKSEALQLAKNHSLDLVEIAPNSKPPVCHILDWGKYKYEESKHKKATHPQKIHEVKFGVNIADHDFGVKLKIIRKFLDHKDKVKILITFKGRQNAHKELGLELSDRILKELGTVIHTQPSLAGKNITFFVE